MSDVFSHPWLGGLFGDAAAQTVWSAETQLSHMLAFEAAWARARGNEAAARAVEGWEPDLALLREGTARDGMPVPALTRALKDAAPDQAHDIHAGATSQDVIDTALAMTLRATSDLIETRLVALKDALDAAADRFGAKRIMGRTRMQDALEIDARTRLETWSRPVPRHLVRLAKIRPSVETVQIGGPVGDRRAISPGIVETVAEHLSLAPGPCWHADRDALVDYANLLSLVAGSCGKIGQDIALMALTGEIAMAGGGTSSAMAHKQNPVMAETTVALARYAQAQAAAMQGAQIHEFERSGAMWSLEWMLLPGLAKAACRSLSLTTETIAAIERIGPEGS